MLKELLGSQRRVIFQHVPAEVADDNHDLGLAQVVISKNRLTASWQRSCRGAIGSSAGLPFQPWATPPALLTPSCEHAGEIVEFGEEAKPPSSLERVKGIEPSS
jgi:hypothetical protein